MIWESVVDFPEEATLYDILQVSPAASPEVIRAAYRILARTVHPDVSAASDAENRTRRLNAARQSGEPGVTELAAQREQIQAQLDEAVERSVNSG